jgi:hypothetical protein
MTTESYILAIVLIVCATPFHFLVGESALRHFIIEKKADKQRLRVFLQRLRFPFSVYKMSEETLEEYFTGVQNHKGNTNRLAPSVVPISIAGAFILAHLSRGFNDLSEATIVTIVCGVMLLPTIMMWGFGKNM